MFVWFSSVNMGWKPIDNYLTISRRQSPRDIDTFANQTVFSLMDEQNK